MLQVLQCHNSSSFMSGSGSIGAAFWLVHANIPERSVSSAKSAFSAFAAVPRQKTKSKAQIG